MSNKEDRLQNWQLWGTEPTGGFPISEPLPQLQPSKRSTHHVAIALRMWAILTVLTGVVYPVGVTWLAKVFFPRQANGSVVTANGQSAGSELLAQRFADVIYFWPRPSAGDDGTNYATVPSAASNQGPTSGVHQSNVLARAAAFRHAHGLQPDVAVPSDMLYASGSGLDPHISPESARLQSVRVAKARQLSPEQAQKLTALVEQFVERPQLGFLGEPRVNVLRLNLALNQNILGDGERRATEP